MKRLLAIATVVAMGALPLVDACRDPTYVSVLLTTDVPCDRLQGVTITVGTLGALEDKIPATRTSACKGGEIGTISLVPTGGNEDELGIRAVMGVGRDVESCTAPNYGDGCVVARRGLRYLSHQTLTLPVVLRQICNGIPCGPYETCIKGICKSAKVEDPQQCTTPDGCNEDTFVQVIGDAAPPPTGRTAMERWCGTKTIVDLAAPWPMRGGCPTQAGRAGVVGPSKAGSLDEIDPKLWSSFVVAANDLGYGTRNDDTPPSTSVAAFDLKTKTARVSPSGLLTNDIASCILVTNEGALCVPYGRRMTVGASGAATSTAFDAFDGATVTMKSWTVANEHTVYALLSPTFAELDVVALYSSGMTRWQKVLGTTPVPTPAPVLSSDETTLFVASSTTLYALDPATGTERWQRPVDVRAMAFHVPTSTLVTVDVGSSPVSVRRFALDGSDAGSSPLPETADHLVWSLALGQGEVAYVVSAEHAEAVGFDGTQRWKIDGAFVAPLVVDAADKLFFPDESDVVHVVDGLTGAPLYTQPPGQQAAIYDIALAGDGSLILAQAKLWRTR